MLGPPADAPHHTAALVTAGIRKQIATCRGRGLDLRDRTLQLLGYARVLRGADFFSGRNGAVGRAGVRPMTTATETEARRRSGAGGPGERGGGEFPKFPIALEQDRSLGTP